MLQVLAKTVNIQGVVHAEGIRLTQISPPGSGSADFL